MRHTSRNLFSCLFAQGLGRFKLENMVPCQTEFVAPGSGAVDPMAKAWDWNSVY